MSAIDCISTAGKASFAKILSNVFLSFYFFLYFALISFSVYFPLYPNLAQNHHHTVIPGSCFGTNKLSITTILMTKSRVFIIKIIMTTYSWNTNLSYTVRFIVIRRISYKQNAVNVSLLSINLLFLAFFILF